MRFGVGVLGLVSVMAMVTGCAAGVGAPAESSEIGTETSPISFATRTDLPKCSDSTSSLFAYIEDEHVEVGCLDGTWLSPIKPT